ncbi:MAG TPA: molecular chaperone DnaJ [Actinomycetota bacterium]|jgi:molecular chaperone DnaJ|nr:molecular chaperone DnaJ [Actinomycetota bacterium]
MATDYYAALGVSREATAEEVKRAYRKLARQHHPDANQQDPDAAERFKEITRAYEVLSDPDKRQRYDMFGDERAGAGAAGFADFGGISDLFQTFFGGGFTGAGARRGPARGADILAEVVLTLEEAAAGAEREVTLDTLVECEMCAGSGASPGTYPSRCRECGGAGEVRTARRTMLGNVITATPCPVCGGTGERIDDPCKRCSGQGRVRVSDTLTVGIPAGVDDGAQLRVTGRGQAGARGGRSGDLYVSIRVTPHPVFRRAGEDLGCEVAVPMTIAALGGEIEVPTLEDPETIDIAPGTQSGEVVRLKGRGMPRVERSGRGELVVLLKVDTPTDLDPEQAELLRRLAELRGENAGTKGFFDKLKQAFR